MGALTYKDGFELAFKLAVGDIEAELDEETFIQLLT